LLLADWTRNDGASPEVVAVDDILCRERNTRRKKE
jgi:hypothetical protein